MSKVEGYIFTFGSGQANEGRYVFIEGNYTYSRKRMYKLFGEKWGFQYSVEEWDRWVNEAMRRGIPLEREISVEEAKRNFERAKAHSQSYQM